MNPRALPDSFLRRMSPESRKSLGVKSPDEIAEHQAVKAERELHNQFANWLRINDYQFGHARMDRKSSYTEGWPDFTVIRGGKVALIEFKAEGGKLSQEQERLIAELLACNTAVLVTTDVVEAMRFVKEKLG